MQEYSMSYDILKEFFNISVGQAAEMLSDIVDQKILLDVPDVEIINITKDEFEVVDYMPENIKGTLMVSSIAFKDSFTGTASMIFPADKMKKFVGLCMHEETSEYEDNNFNDVDFDIIKEIGNVILNCIIGGTANSLHVNFEYSLPEVKIFRQDEFNDDLKKSEDMHLLILYISFIIGDTEIEGAIIVDFTLNSLNELIKQLDSIWENDYE